MMADYTYKELTVTTTAGDASNKIDFNPGPGESKFYVFIINTDSTNFIRVGFDSKRNANATDIKVKAGETFITSKAVQGLCFLADTSNVLIRYLILSEKPEADVIKAIQRVHKYKGGSIVDDGNSTTSTLTSGSVFTGTGVDLLGYTAVSITLFASHDSATDGMTFEFSTDNSNWDDVYKFEMDVSEETTRRFQFPVSARYFRIKYTNGGTNQTSFRVLTILHTENLLTTIHRLKDEVIDDRSALLSKSVIIAQRAGGTNNFIAIQATAAGNLKMSVQEISDGLDVGAGNASSETQRVSIATNDVNLSAIKTAIEGTVVVSEASPSTIIAFVTDIPSAATRVQLASNTVVAGVLQAPSTNTGIVYIGGSNVSSTVFGAELQPGQSIGLAINNTNKIWIDAASSGDDAAFIGS